MAQSFFSEGLVKSLSVYCYFSAMASNLQLPCLLGSILQPQSLGCSASIEAVLNPTEQENQDTKQTEELVPVRWLPLNIQRDNPWFERKWRHCDGCRAKCMLFGKPLNSITENLRQQPLTSVMCTVRSVGESDPKHMCKECNVHKSFYDGETDAVYILRQWGYKMYEITGDQYWKSHDLTRVMMKVASFFVVIGKPQLQKFRDS